MNQNKRESSTSRRSASKSLAKYKRDILQLLKFDTTPFLKKKHFVKNKVTSSSEGFVVVVFGAVPPQVRGRQVFQSVWFMNLP